MTVCNSGDVNLDQAVNGWLKLDKNQKTRQEVVELISAARWDELRKTMLGRQRFGTAGLRGRMAAGYKCMNDVVILQTAQGLCSYIKKQCEKSQLENGIVVGYDGRYNSKRFAELTAKVFVSASIPVHLFSAVCPTPLISFGTILYRSAAGVMVTASHNPKEDNGYKVYWGNGCQIISPHDDNVLEEILLCLDIPEDHWNIEELRSHSLVTDCTQHVTDEYMKYIRESLRSEVLAENERAAIATAYSAMHGVGHRYVVDAFKAAGLKEPISVAEQQDPNPDFPTVKFPNPEETECLKLGRSLAEARGVRLLLVNDPDADRLAVAEYDPSEGSWKVFTGNEMGALLGGWVLRQHWAAGGGDAYVIASLVSSKMLAALVKGRGHFVETLTGFKWMGNKALSLARSGRRAVFAFEEAIGYMCAARVPDKDGVSAAVHVASMASHLYSRGSSLVEHLDELYAEYGYHVTHNSYYLCHDPCVMQKIFKRIRNYHGPGKYPEKVGSCVIESIHDLTAGVKIPDNAHGDDLADVEGTGLDVPYTSGEMVVLRGGGLALALRSSGTEPKLKYYSERVCRATTRSEQEQMQKELKETVQELVNELLQPEQNGLKG